MPIESKGQQRWAYANKDKPGSEGKAAADFVAAGPKGGSFAALPERVAKKGNQNAGAVIKKSFQKLINQSKSRRI
jgi:hypothetical protein